MNSRRDVSILRNEDAPLLIEDPHHIDDGGLIEDVNRRGRAMLGETIVNLMKSCMGTGCLALPFACQQGGIIIFLAGVPLIASWNIYSVHRLCLCLEYIPPQQRQETLVDGMDHAIRRGYPPAGTTTLGVVAWYAFGPLGLYALNFMLLTFFFGVIVAYLVAIEDFLRDTPLTIGVVWDSVLFGCLMVFLSRVPDLGYLSRVSALGLCILILSFFVIAFKGIVSDHSVGNSQLYLWPRTLVGLSHWFGINVLGYGIVPLTYNFRESMKDPDRLVECCVKALIGVVIVYWVIGIGIYTLFPAVQGQVLHELGGGIVSILIRLAMAWVVLMTAPLLIVPCSELLEGRSNASSPLARDAIRCGIVFSAIGVAIFVPSFVQALALVGCACVGLLGFCGPPLLHLRLSTLQTGSRPNRHGERVVDFVLLLWGILATITSTMFAIGKV